MTEQKKTLTVKERVGELIYDVKNKAYLTGQARQAQQAANYEAASNMQASDDNENSYQIRRSIANAFSALKSLLGEYLVDTSTSTNNLDAYKKVDGDDAKDDLTLTFSLPSNFNQASADSLGNSIHAYLVAKSLAEWFTITCQTEVQAYEAQALTALENAKRALYKRSRPTRPTYA